MKAAQALAFFQSAHHLHSFTSLKQRNALPPPSSPIPGGSGSGNSDGTSLSFSDFLNMAPDDLRSYIPPPISPVRLRTAVDLSHSVSKIAAAGDNFA
jgi:hypothetical protein